jgi:APA family basic amino acid/polyamine antiporter
MSKPSNLINSPALRRTLGPISAAAIVVGGVIGSGIFFQPGQVAANTGGHLGLILALWIGCGLVNLCGALAQAELAAMFPAAGGSYIFLREAYGNACALAWAWAEFWVVRTGAIAALAVALTMSLRPLLADAGFTFTDAEWLPCEKAVAVACIALLGLSNIAGVIWGGLIQNITTAIKVIFILVLAALPFVTLGEQHAAQASYWPESFRDASLWAGLGAALGGIMWAYDGWGNLTVVAEEVREPQRAIPQALAGGVALVIVLYVGANIAFHQTLTAAELSTSPIPPVDVMVRLIGPRGGRLMLVMLMISVFGSLNQIVLTGPRILLAAGRDYASLALLGRVHPRTRTPAIAIATLCLWSCVLVLLGDVGVDAADLAKNKRLFDMLTSYCIFGGSIFYLLAVVAVFVLRRRRPDAERPFLTPGYPLTPLAFVVFYIALLASMLASGPRECLAGLAFVAVGFVAAWLLGRRNTIDKRE